MHDAVRWLLACVMALTFVVAPVSVVADGEADQTDAEPPAEARRDKESPDAEQDLGDILSGASSVRVATMCTNCNVANVTMCGQTGDHIQVIADGVPVAGGLGGIYLFSVAPSETIVKTDIIRGAGTVLSGNDAAVGAVIFETRAAGPTPGIWVSTDFGSYGWSGQKAMLSGSAGSVGGVLTMTRSRSDGIDANGDGNFNQPELARDTVAGDLIWNVSPQTSVRAGYLRYDEEQLDNKGAYAGGLPIDFGRFYKEDVEILRDETYLAFRHGFDDGSRLAITARYTTRDQDTSDNSPLYARQPYMQIEEEILLADARYTRTVWGSHVLTAGVFHQDLQTDGVIWDFGEEQRISDIIEQEAAFAEFEFSLPHRLNLTLGARYDDLGQFGSRVSPRTRLAWKATPELNLVLSAGGGFSAPRPILERICCGARVQSNSSVRAESSENILLDIDYVPAPWLRINGALFRNDYDGFIEKRATWAYPYFHPSLQQVNYDKVRIEGGEISTELRMGDWTFAGTGTVISARHDDPLLVYPFADVGPSDPFYPFRDFFYEIEPGRIVNHARRQGALSISWEDPGRGREVLFEGQYTGRMLIEQQAEMGLGPVTDVRETPSLWIYNFRTRFQLNRHFALSAGVDNISDVIQSWLDDPRYEYNWGPLRGRYVWAGLSYEL